MHAPDRNGRSGFVLNSISLAPIPAGDAGRYAGIGSATMRFILQFASDVLAGATVHIVLMIFGYIFTTVPLGKMDEGLIHLITCVCIPFAFAGMFISRSGAKFPRTVSALSAVVALMLPPIVIAAYNHWNWLQVGPKYLFAFLGLPFSVVASHYVAQSRLKDTDQVISMNQR